MQKIPLLLYSLLKALGGLAVGLLLSAFSLLVVGRTVLLLTEIQNAGDVPASGVSVISSVLIAALLFLSPALCTSLFLICGLWTAKPGTEPMIFRFLVSSGAALALYILYCLAFMIPDEEISSSGVTAGDFALPAIAACGVVFALAIFIRYVRPRLVVVE